MSAPSWKRRVGRWLLALYLVLLAVTQVFAPLASGPPRPRPGDRVAELPRVGGPPGGDPVRLVYRDSAAEGRGAQPGAPVLVLLHGSPGSLADFDALERYLPPDLRLIVPDLPGFGRSRQELPDYSSAAHARYVLELLDRLGIERAHLVAYSMGGAVALSLDRLAPERVASISMVAAIGVQELELFGDYRLNHFVHGAQLAAIRAAALLLPHLGWLEGAVLGVPYARNFYDTDQRSLRGVLERYDGPMLIVHGEHDPLVAVAVAREHHRIVPQSELLLLDTDHFFLFRGKEQVLAPVAARLADFVHRVEAGTATTRAGADPERVTRAAEPFDPRAAPRAAGFALVLMMALVAVATWVSEDLTCIGVGLLVAEGRIGFVPGTAACLLGIFSGDVLLFLAGRHLGRPAVRRAPLRWFVSEAGVERASQWFARRGAWAIFLSRLMPGLRLPTYFAAGVLRTRLLAFSLYFLIAGAFWTPLLVGVAAWSGEQAERTLDVFERYTLPALLGLGVAIFSVQRIGLPLLSHRGRRLLRASWRRKVRWEYWPPWIFYVPVAAWIGWLALKHRGLALVTAVNPAIPTGGFIGESKHAILARLRDGAVARCRLIPAALGPAERRSAAEDFLAGSPQRFPLVLKPDVGQRGSGVRVLRGEAALERALEDLRVDSLLQEYAPGEEYGVFWYRRPGEAHGRVFSITAKRLPVVVGDGERTLEQLILDDERASTMAPAHLARNAERLFDVLAPGERVALVDVGTHCLGALFSDATHLATPELERALDRICEDFEGFCFGRFDLKVPSPEALAAGEELKVIELNGLTSEATHVYDAGFGAVDAYRVLFRQWELAFEIARANLRSGARPATLLELGREVLAYRRLQRAH